MSFWWLDGIQILMNMMEIIDSLTNSSIASHVKSLKEGPCNVFFLYSFADVYSNWIILWSSVSQSVWKLKRSFLLFRLKREEPVYPSSSWRFTKCWFIFQESFSNIRAEILRDKIYSEWPDHSTKVKSQHMAVTMKLV